MLACNCCGSAKSPSSRPNVSTALTTPAVAGTMNAFSAFCSLTMAPSNRRRRAAWIRVKSPAATSTASLPELSTSSYSKPTSNCSVRCDLGIFPRATVACSACASVSASISAPLTWPSRYGENSLLYSAQFMVSPQPLCHPLALDSVLSSRSFDVRTSAGTTSPNSGPDFAAHMPPASCAAHRARA